MRFNPLYKFKVNLRFGLRSQLFLLSCFLFTIPWFGYQYVWEMEKYLRFGQEQTIIGTARALATALHERPNLFNNQASFLPNVEQGKDLYSYQLSQPIQLDGFYNDWPEFDKRAHFYGFNNQITPNQNTDKLSLHFNSSLGKYEKYLYIMISVVDNQLIYRSNNARSITNNDHLELAFVDPQGQFNRFIISNKKSGWLNAYRISDLINNIPIAVPQIQGYWLETPQGYNVELRLPLSFVGDNIAFTVNDVDIPFGTVTSIIGSADPSKVDTLGTILVPSPEIERIVKGMSYTNSSIWVVDQHHRVLAKAGDLKKASGVWNNKKEISSNSIWQTIEQQWLLPLYYNFLTKPPKDFIDQLYDAQNLTGKHIESALLGSATSQWRLTQDQQAVILSAAYPIYINNQVHGAVIVEETTNGIRTLRNRALEKLFSAILAIMLLGTFSFFLFASRISNRIRTLRNQAELSIDEHGRINSNLIPSTANDEIGDLSRSFSTAVNRLSQYNHYLENMSSRLSHELRTPIAIVRTSLENLAMQTLPESAASYIQRAQTGIGRLNLILTNMSEATRIEQMLINTDRVNFNFNQVLSGCVHGYQQIYPGVDIKLIRKGKTKKEENILNGSPEHIAQLLDKVIANAVEFSQDNIVNIVLVESNNTITLHISNNGILLPQQMKERLFDSMVSIRPANKQSQPHLGLGLYIARLIVEFHQGHISASDHHNPQGVTVSIDLPLL